MDSENVSVRMKPGKRCSLGAVNASETVDQRVRMLEKMLREEREFSAGLMERLRSLDEEVELNWRTQCKRCTCGLYATTVNDLPDEMMIKIFSYLDGITQLNIRRVNQRWNALLQTTVLAKSLTLDLAMIPAHATRPHLQMLGLLLPPGPSLLIRGLPKRLLDTHTAEPREFAHLWTAQILEALIKSRSATYTTLRHLTITDCFVRLNWLANRLPDSLETLRLVRCAVMQPATPGIHYEMTTPCSIVVGRGAPVEMAGVRGIGLWKRLWAMLDAWVVPLDAEQVERLTANLQRLPRKDSLAAVFLLRAKEPAYWDFAEDIHLPRINVTHLRPTTQHELCRMLLDCSDIRFDVSEAV